MLKKSSSVFTRYSIVDSKRKRRFKNSEKGMATVESIPMLFLLVVILSFSLGFFGSIHSGILNSIGAYNYALETFRFKSDLMYLRPGADPKENNYKLSNNRVHGILAEGEEAGQQASEDWLATQRSIAYTFSPEREEEEIRERTRTLASEANRKYGERGAPNNIWTVISTYVPKSNSDIRTPRIWIKTVYGICVNADCGEDPN
ncbi:hypothetical protein [Pseudobdellovibrio exovorus]|uniref:Uncharacterized protein n=1 Tax=Pseudobdellovibrio exovorus JSS TaxID=1184267 RepID=M4VEX3_9BACT|nr:hypothetical protein [Pseudobdellovibrio exovorus]AGH96586.1 hypothetical protein A11Q_2370 [Pseudobdellovibrio exovorus JSS]